MKNDKVILIFMIVNIIILTLVVSIINSNQKQDKMEEKKDDKPIEEVINGSKKCYLTNSTKYIEENKIVIINYTNDVINSYTYNYNLINNSKKYSEFNNKKNEMESFVSTYQSNKDVNISNYKSDNAEYNISLSFDLSKIYSTSILPLNYGQKLEDAVDALKKLSFTCEEQ